MFVVGLTGGIGSGKSAVSERFARQGIEIVDADIASRVVVEPGQPSLVAIAEHFGKEVITPDGRLDRALMRSKVFADAAERRWLEKLLHPPSSGLSRTEDPCLAFAVHNPRVAACCSNRNNGELTHRALVVDVPEEMQITRTASARRQHARTSEGDHGCADVARRPPCKGGRRDRQRPGARAPRPEVARLHDLYLDLAARHGR